jgi:hypothetical protein
LDNSEIQVLAGTYRIVKIQLAGLPANGPTEAEGQRLPSDVRLVD